MNRCILGDCLEFMATLPDNAFDLAIVDPPYGIGEAKKQRLNTPCKRWKAAPGDAQYKPSDWDRNIPSPEYFIELFRISSEQIIWGGNYMTDNLRASMGWVFWDKKTGESDFSDGELAWTSFHKGLRKFEWLWSGFKKQQPEVRIHHTQKPVALYKWLLKNYAKPGQTIFDSHVGSGSIRIACHDMGYDFTGCEIDPDYHAAQEKRFQTHISQAQLFEPAELTAQYHQEEL